MSNVYIIMKKEKSPVFITSAKVHGYCVDLATAKKLVSKLNAVATTNKYWYDKAKLLEV